MKKILSFISGVTLFFALGMAGECDRVDSIIYNMPDETYNKIKKDLSCHGREPSDRQIAEYYIKRYNP